MKIVILDGYACNPGDLSWQRLEELGELVVYDRTPPELINQRIADAEVVLTNKAPIDADALKHAPKLKYIGVLATGYNIIDIEAARQHGVVVTNVPDYSADTVAETVFAYLLKIYHEVALHSASVKVGDWTNCADFCYWKTPLFELANKTIGIVGYGKIGRRVATIAKAFKMQVLIFHHNTAAGTEKNGVKFVSFEQLLSASDIITLHIPLFETTRNIIDKVAISKMKDGVILINTARGPLIDEKAVAAALNDGKIAHLAVDVVSQEPIPADNPLLLTPNTLITPHIAWAPYETRVRLIDVVADNIKAFYDGNVVNQVN